MESHKMRKGKDFRPLSEQVNTMSIRSRKRYNSDLSDEEWANLDPLVPPGKPGGRPRSVDMREVINTLRYQARTGCPWDYLPHDLLPKSTVHDYFAKWRDDGTWQSILDALREKVREQTPLPPPKTEQPASPQQPNPPTGNDQQGTTTAEQPQVAQTQESMDSGKGHQ